MLVLSRKVGERVLVGDKVVVTIVRIGPNAVRLGIAAPQDMNIVRGELVLPNSVLGSLANVSVELVTDGRDVELVGVGDLVEA